MASFPANHQLPNGHYYFHVSQGQQGNLHPQNDTTVQMNLWKMSDDSGTYVLAGTRECRISHDATAAEEDRRVLTLKTHLIELGIVQEEAHSDAIEIVMDCMRPEDVMVVMDIYEPGNGDGDSDEEEEEGETEVEVRMVPASEAAIAGLDKVKVEEGAAAMSCAICMEEDKEMFSRMPCTHVFHTECVEKWLRISSYCPICRYAMPVQD